MNYLKMFNNMHPGCIKLDCDNSGHDCKLKIEE